MRLPIELESKLTTTDCSPSEVEGELLAERIERLEALATFRLAAKDNIKGAQEKQKELYDAKRSLPKYQKGDCVWYRNVRRDTRKGGKLDSVWAGKANIKEVLDKGTYKLEGLSRIYNGIQLKPFVQRDPVISAPSPTADTMGTSACDKPDVAEVLVEKAVAGSHRTATFNPPNIHWQRSVCDGSGGQLAFKKKSGPTGCVLHVPFSNFSPATRVRKIKGDGNCFFRSISYVITGDEDSHGAVRQMVCSYIEASESTVLYGKNQTGLQYLNASNMRNAGVWGTTDEILATANLLQLTIFVRSHYGLRLAWQRHAPRKAPDSPFAIYLDNSSGCHFEVVMSVKKK